MILRLSELKNEVGLDEVGRGPGAGPVVAAAVLLPPDWNDPRIRDSKKLSMKNREMLDEVIKGSALAWGIGEVTPQEIDKLNILNATFLAMERSLRDLESKGVTPEYLAVDGNIFKTPREIPYSTLVKGDDKHLSIAAASILAKVYRDRLMGELHTQFPQYGWETNMGYLSQAHIEAIKKYGITPHHRTSFLGKIVP